MNKVYRNDGVIGQKEALSGFYKKGKVYNLEHQIIGYYDKGCIYSRLEQGGKGKIVGYYEHNTIYNEDKQYVVANFHHGKVCKKRRALGSYDGNDDGGAAASYLLLLNGLNYKHKLVADYDVSFFLILLGMIPLCILLFVVSEKYLFLHPEYTNTIHRNMSISSFGAIVVFMFLCMANLKEIKFKQIIYQALASLSIGYWIAYVLFGLDFIFFHNRGLNIVTIFIGLLVLLVMNCLFMSKAIFYLIGGVILAYFWSNYFNSTVEKKVRYLFVLSLALMMHAGILKYAGDELVSYSFHYLFLQLHSYEFDIIVKMIMNLNHWGFFSIALGGCVLMLGYYLQIHKVLKWMDIIKCLLISIACYSVYIAIIYVSAALTLLSWVVTFVLIAIVIIFVYKKVEEWRQEA